MPREPRARPSAWHEYQVLRVLWTTAIENNCHLAKLLEQIVHLDVKPIN